MTCETLLEDLPAYRDRELPLARRLTVHWHLAHCAACREELKFMETITQELRASEPTELDPALRAKLLEHLPEFESQTVVAIPLKRGRPNLLKWSAAAVVAATVLGIAFTVNRPAGMAPVADMAASPPLAGGNSVAEAAGNEASAPSSASLSAAAGSAPAIQTERKANKTMAPGQSGVNITHEITPYVDQPAGIPATAGANPNDNLPPSMRVVHKDAKLAVEVKGLEDQSDEVTQIVTVAGGYVLTSTITSSAEGGRQANLDIRIPVDKFDNALARIAKLGEVKEKNVTGEDITDQTTDSQQSFGVYFNDMSTKEAELQEAQKHHRSDQWKLESELRDLRISAAQAKARLENLKRLGAMANLQVELREPPAAPKAGGFLGDLGDNGHDAYDTFLIAARVPLNVLMWLLAYCPIWLPALLVLYFWNKMYGKRV